MYDGMKVAEERSAAAYEDMRQLYSDKLTLELEKAKPNIYVNKDSAKLISCNGTYLIPEDDNKTVLTGIEIFKEKVAEDNCKNYQFGGLEFLIENHSEYTIHDLSIESKTIDYPYKTMNWAILRNPQILPQGSAAILVVLSETVYNDKHVFSDKCDNFNLIRITMEFSATYGDDKLVKFYHTFQISSSEGNIALSAQYGNVQAKHSYFKIDNFIEKNKEYILNMNEK
ncbi:MAG: hypothetical protein CVU98_06030 [Firmicutes bacterium HGW-Firmicutes-3]|nr:MAG: hypothetical protein CVU98_06030 [Firmicutes bacterium HGW-Firmicutes-3]